MRILTILMVGCIAVVLTNGVLPTMFSSFYYNIGVRTLDPEVFLGAETFSAWLWGAPAFVFYLIAVSYIAGVCLLATDRTWWIGWGLFFGANLPLAVALERRLCSIVLVPEPGLLIQPDGFMLSLIGYCLIVSAIALVLKALHREDILRKPQIEE